LEAPINLAISNIRNTGCTLSWTGTYLATGYKIYQHLPTTAVYTIPANMTYTFNNLISNTNYEFSVSAINNDGESLPSSAVGLHTPSLASPTNLMASNVTVSGCTLSWSAPYGLVSGYYIYQDGVKVQTTSATSTTIYNLTANGTYTFAVSAYYNYEESGQSNTVIVNISSSAVPSAPTNLAASNITSNGCTLSWTASSGTVTGYYIYIL
jgi:chitodextrinase